MKCSIHKWNNNHCCDRFHKNSVLFHQFLPYNNHLALHFVCCIHILKKWFINKSRNIVMINWKIPLSSAIKALPWTEFLHDEGLELVSLLSSEPCHWKMCPKGRLPDPTSWMSISSLDISTLEFWNKNWSTSKFNQVHELLSIEIWTYVVVEINHEISKRGKKNGCQEEFGT